jgi:hypothetical protein
MAGNRATSNLLVGGSGRLSAAAPSARLQRLEVGTETVGPLDALDRIFPTEAAGPTIGRDEVLAALWELELDERRPAGFANSDALREAVTKRRRSRQENVTQVTGAAAALHAAFTPGNDEEVSYAIHGSYAAVIHGAPITAADIDVVVSDMSKATAALTNAGFAVAGGGSLLVRKFIHLSSRTQVDVVVGGKSADFGIDPGRRELRNGVFVLPVAEVLISLVVRHDRRPKDTIAFGQLARRRGPELSDADRQRVIVASKMTTDWDTLMSRVVPF